MKAIVVQPDGALRWMDVPEPSVGSAEVKIRVRATALNRADLLQRKGLYPPPPGVTDILGLECAGTIVDVGSKVRDWHVGDAVCALLPGGGYAEFVTVHHQLLFPIPNGWSMEEAAALPEALCTATVNLVKEAKMRRGEKVLIHSGAGGVGTIAIQLVRQLGAIPVATAGTAAKRRLCEQLGAQLAVDYQSSSWRDQIQQAVGKLDIVLDTVGAAFLPQHLELLNYRGRLVLIGLLGGRTAEIRLDQVLLKNLRIVGSTLRNRPLREKIRLCRFIRSRLWHLVENRRIVPVIDSVFDIRDAEAAHDRMRRNLHAGKIVLRIPESSATGERKRNDS